MPAACMRSACAHAQGLCTCALAHHILKCVHVQAHHACKCKRVHVQVPMAERLSVRVQAHHGRAAVRL